MLFLMFISYVSPWKLATIIMILKPGKDLKISTNYHPISLLNTMVKLFESLLLSRIERATDYLIRPEQFAFRTDHSTTTQLTKLVDEFATTFNKKL